MNDAILSRVRDRLNGEDVDAVILAEIVNCVVDRLCVRLNTTAEVFPSALYYIPVEVAVAYWRRHTYEGITSETVGTVSVSFIRDLLTDYDYDIKAYVNAHAGEGGAISSDGLVRFL